MKNLLYLGFLSILLLQVNFTNAANINTTGSGNWEDSGTWDLGRVPANGDVVNIGVDHTVTMTTNNTTCDGAPATMVIIEGVLTFNNGKKLNLGCGSIITLSKVGTVDGGSGGGAGKKIIICNNEEWNSSDPDVVGPAMIPGMSGDGAGVITGANPDSLSGLDEAGAGFSGGLGIADVQMDAGGYTKMTIVPGEASEEIEYIEIYRSGNGLNYEWLGRIEIGEVVDNSASFEYIDEDPLIGTSYYKYNKTDSKGETTTSQPYSFNNYNELEGSCLLTIYPNPCPGNCRAKLTDCPEGSAEMRLMMTDATGHIVNEVYPTRDFDGSFDVQIDKSNNLKPGIYIISAVSEEEKHSSKVIVK